MRGGKIRGRRVGRDKVSRKQRGGDKPKKRRPEERWEERREVKVRGGEVRDEEGRRKRRGALKTALVHLCTK